MFKGAKWIECAVSSESPIFRKAFNAEKGEKARIIICGLGFFKLFINGNKVSDDLLVPNATDYSERDLTKLYYKITDKRQSLPRIGQIFKKFFCYCSVKIIQTVDCQSFQAMTLIFLLYFSVLTTL